LDAYLCPLEEGLSDLPRVTVTDQGLAKLKNGNPGMVVAHGVEYGDECWAAYDDHAVAVGRFKAGELHPSRVFNS
jgi:tRNA pseudouridine55 synthase